MNLYVKTFCYCLLIFVLQNCLFSQSDFTKENERFKSVGSWLRTYPEHLVAGVEKSFLEKEAPYLLISGSISIAAMSYFDDNVSKNKPFFSDQFSTVLDKFGRRFGWGYFAGIGFVTFESIVSKNTNPEYFAKLEILLESIAVTQVITQGLKVSIERQRPNKSDDHSFPSGHTSSTFALASALHGIYGWNVGGPAYICAILVGAQRISSNSHYLSDVLAGAMIGYVVGRGFSIVHSEESKSYLSPYLLYDKNSSAIKAGFILNL